MFRYLTVFIRLTTVFINVRNYVLCIFAIIVSPLPFPSTILSDPLPHSLNYFQGSHISAVASHSLWFTLFLRPSYPLSN